MTAAVTANGDSLIYASTDLQHMIKSDTKEFNRSALEALKVYAASQIVQVSAGGGYSQQMEVACCNMGGDQIATVFLQEGDGANELHHLVASALGVFPTALHIILPRGIKVRDAASTKSLRELFGLA